MSRLLLVGLAAVLGLAPSVHAQARKNVILYIGDGYGISPKTAARMAMGQGQDGSRFSTDPNFRLLASDRLPYNTTVTTHSLNSWVTDSAPGATVYSAGQAGKVDNEFIAMNPATLAPIETILEAARKQGYAVGIVSTARITHATPASFASHIWNRDLEDYIAAQYVSATQAEYEGVFNASAKGGTYDAAKDWVLPAPKVGVQLDVILGGGARHFLPSARAADGCSNANTPNGAIVDRNGAIVANPDGEAVRASGRRSDCVDLVEVARARGYTYVNSRDALLGLDMDQFAGPDGQSLLGLFTDSHMSYEQERHLYAPYEPSLTDMTEAAIEVLERKSDKGYFLIVESGRIDHLEHANAGGITVENGQLAIKANFEAFLADDVYAGVTTRDVAGPVYGSDYVIKEVLAFDYAIQAGREYLQEAGNGETLIFQTADHECGGFAAVSLNDPSRATGSRTYAGQPTQDGTSSPKRATPDNVARGASWFPRYAMEDFQGQVFPAAMADGNRIVISYGSNPVVNGNGTAQRSNGSYPTPGNHTPADIFVGAEDNVGGSFARRITGRGLLDNTDLFPIMRDFLAVTVNTSVVGGPDAGALDLTVAGANPTGGAVSLTLSVDVARDVRVVVYDAVGRRVAVLHDGPLAAGLHSVAGQLDVASGAYLVRAETEGASVARRLTVVR